MSLELAIPNVRQSTGYTCGPASLCAILRYYGHKRITERALARRARTTADGTAIQGLLDAARSYGVEPWVWEQISYQMLRNVNELGHPVIAVIQAWDEKPEVKYDEEWDCGHYVVVTDVDGLEVTCMDPSMPGSRAIVPADEWMDRWHDLDMGRELNRCVIVFPTGAIRRRRVGRVKRMG